jgi:hypothetical protein
MRVSLRAHMAVVATATDAQKPYNSPLFGSPKRLEEAQPQHNMDEEVSDNIKVLMYTMEDT